MLTDYVVRHYRADPLQNKSTGLTVYFLRLFLPVDIPHYSFAHSFPLIMLHYLIPYFYAFPVICNNV